MSQKRIHTRLSKKGKPKGFQFHPDFFSFLARHPNLVQRFFRIALSSTVCKKKGQN